MQTGLQISDKIVKSLSYYCQGKQNCPAIINDPYPFLPDVVSFSEEFISYRASTIMNYICFEKKHELGYDRGICLTLSVAERPLNVPQRRISERASVLSCFDMPFVCRLICIS